MKCLISCGGTGGHLAPGVALAEGLQARGHEGILLVSQKQVDTRLLKSHPELTAVQVPGKPFSLSPIRLISFALSQTRSILYALKLLQQHKPDIVFGFGGYTTMGVCVAAFLLNVPIVLHEANRRPGKAVRLLSGLAQRVYLPMGVKLRSLLPKTIRHYGYPLRKCIRKVSVRQARKNLGLNVEGRLLVVMGGSQGANSLNTWAKDNFENLAKDGINLCCVTGLNKGSEGVVEHKNEDGDIVRAYFMPFCDQMADLLCAADLIVARAGAGSIAEFVACHTPSILVPFPYAADNHQQANAEHLEQQGGSIILDEKSIDSLLSEVQNTIFNEWLLNRMKMNLEKLSQQDNLKLILMDTETIAAEYRGSARQQTKGYAWGD